jgi:hypothetical protein
MTKKLQAGIYTWGFHVKFLNIMRYMRSFLKQNAFRETYLKVKIFSISQQL